MKTVVCETRITRLIAAVAILAFAGLPRVQAQVFTNLHIFTNGGDGASPNGVILSSNTLYGTTEGESGSLGNVFEINTNGSGFNVLHAFTNTSDGIAPRAGLVLSGHTLYGTTSAGGGSNCGTIFKINTDGSGFQTLYEFTGGNDGKAPLGLIMSSNTLYGTTAGDLLGDYGTVFKINTDGTGYQTLFHFTGDNGARPGGLVLSGHTLYATTYYGGSLDWGTVFKINTDGTGFETLYEFMGEDDGNYPGGLVLSGTTLFGTTTGFGTNTASNAAANGTLFRINTDGTGFQTLYAFTGGKDGGTPGGLILSDSKLFGTTGGGGNSDGTGWGTVFEINTDGTALKTLYVYTNTVAGAIPGSVLLSDNTLYGTTGGDIFTTHGSVFSLAVPMITSDNLHDGEVLTNQMLPALTGSAWDPPSGIASVQVYLNRLSGGVAWWNGSSWSTNAASLTASYDPQTAVWQVTDPLPGGADWPNGDYQLQVSAVNNATPPNSLLLTVNFSVSYHPVYVFNYGSQNGPTPNLNWSNPANWDAGSVPTTNARVVISGYSPDATSYTNLEVYELDLFSGTLHARNLQLDKLNVSGGAINAGTLTLEPHGTANWSGGTFSDTNLISPGAVMTINGASNKTLQDNAVIMNRGTINWQGGGLLLANGYSHPSYITNEAGAVFEATGDGPVFGTAQGDWMVFANAGGSFGKAVGMGTNSVTTCNFYNSGEIRCDSGTLAFDSDLNLYTNSWFAGRGISQVAGGSLHLTGLTVISNSVLDLAKGQFTGAADNSGTFGTVGSGKLIWSGGEIHETINLAAQSETELSSPNDKVFADNAALNNSGHITWLDGNIVANGYSYPSFLRNLPGSHFTLSATNRAVSHYGVAGVFENLAGGTLTITNTGTSFWNGWQFTNNGSLDGLGGTLALAAGGGATGLFDMASGSELDFTGGTYLLHNRSLFTGDGTIRIAGATVTADGNAVSQGSHFELDSGRLDGVGFRSTGQFDWNGGNIGGTFSNAFGATLTLNGSNTMVLDDNAIIENAGTAVLNSQLFANGYNYGATWNNLDGAEFDLAADGSNFGTVQGGWITFNNQAGARVAKTGGTNSALDTVALNNSGDLDCETGVLAFNATLNLNPGGTFSGAGGERIIGGSVAWNGINTIQNSRLSFDGGTLTCRSNATVTATGSGLLDWSGGTLAGNLSLANGSTLQLSGAKNKVMADKATLANAGTMVFAGSGSLLANGYNAGATIDNEAGGIIQILTNTTLGNIHGVTASLTNAGSIDFSNTVSWSQGGWNYVQTSSGLLNMTLAGTAAGSAYSQFGGQNVTLDGRLAVTLENGFVPQTTNSFDVLTYTSRSGKFASVSLPSLSPGKVWQSNYNSTAFHLLVEPAMTLANLGSLSDGSFAFDLVGPGGSGLTIQASTNLVNWTTILTTGPFGTNFHFHDTSKPVPPRRYYRTIVQP